MNLQTISLNPEFKLLIKHVETALTQASIDARDLAERTNTPLVTREIEAQSAKKQ